MLALGVHFSAQNGHDRSMTPSVGRSGPYYAMLTEDGWVILYNNLPTTCGRTLPTTCGRIVLPATCGRYSVLDINCAR